MGKPSQRGRRGCEAHEAHRTASTAAATRADDLDLLLNLGLDQDATAATEADVDATAGSAASLILVHDDHDGVPPRLRAACDARVELAAPAPRGCAPGVARERVRR